MPNFFDMSALTEGMIVYYISSKETKLLQPKEVQNVVSAIKIRMTFFSEENNVVPVEDILGIHNVDDTLTEA